MTRKCKRARPRLTTQTPPARELGSRGAPGWPYLSLWELLSQFLHFLPQFPDDFCVGILIHNGMVNDPFGSIGISQCGEGLFVVVCCWANGGDHRGLAVAPQIVLQNISNSILGNEAHSTRNARGKQQTCTDDLLSEENSLWKWVCSSQISLWQMKGGLSLYSRQCTMPVKQHYNGKKATGMSFHPACLGIRITVLSGVRCVVVCTHFSAVTTETANF